MPLTVTASLSRKASRDFQSSGTSITLSAEVDGSLITKPEELQREIARVFDQARVALEAQTEPPTNGAGVAPHRPALQIGSSRHRGNGNGNGGDRFNPATASQLRALAAIARRLGVDERQEIRDEFGVELDRLDVRMASAAIDYLKSLQSPVGDRNGGGR